MSVIEAASGGAQDRRPTVSDVVAVSDWGEGFGTCPARYSCGGTRSVGFAS